MGQRRWEQMASEMAAAAELDHRQLASASDLIKRDELGQAEAMLQALADRDSDDVRALRLLAVIANKCSGVQSPKN